MGDATVVVLAPRSTNGGLGPKPQRGVRERERARERERERE